MLGKYVCVYTANNNIEASTIISFLQALNIPAIKSYESASTAIGINIRRMAEVDILVPVSLANRALDEIARMERGDYIRDDDLSDPDLDNEDA